MKCHDWQLMSVCDGTGESTKRNCAMFLFQVSIKYLWDAKQSQHQQGHSIYLCGALSIMQLSFQFRRVLHTFTDTGNIICIENGAAWTEKCTCFRKIHGSWHQWRGEGKQKKQRKVNPLKYGEKRENNMLQPDQQGVKREVEGNKWNADA